MTPAELTQRAFPKAEQARKNPRVTSRSPAGARTAASAGAMTPTPIASAVGNAFAGHTAQSARLLGLYCCWRGTSRCWGSQTIFCLYLRHALTGERVILAETPASGYQAAMSTALKAIAHERSRLEKPKSLKYRTAAA